MSRRGRTARHRKFLQINKTSNTNSLGYFDIYALTKWMSSHGFTPNKKTKPAFFQETGRGLKCSETIEAEEAIVSIPENLFFTASSACSTLKHCPSQILHNVTELEILMLSLMCENWLGKHSKWHTYLNILPRQYATASELSLSSLDSLPEDLCKEAYHMQNLMKTTFHRLQPVLIWLQSALSVSEDPFELFSWAWNSVNTRCVSLTDYDGADKIALLPYLDLLNHSATAKIQASYNKISNSFEILTKSKIKKYQQIFINYGNHNNRTLFLNYGFVIPGNPNDTIPVYESDLLSLTELSRFVCHTACFEERIRAFENRKFFENCGVCLDGLSWSMKLLLTLICMPCQRRNVVRNSEMADAIEKCEEFCQTELVMLVIKQKLKSHRKGVSEKTHFVVKALLDIEVDILLHALDVYIGN